MPIVKGKKVDPNQSLMEMTQKHTDGTGRTWSKGTLYQPFSAGMAGGYKYQEITIKGETIIFTSRTEDN